MKLIHSLSRPYINYYTSSNLNFFVLLNSGMKWVKTGQTLVWGHWSSLLALLIDLLGLRWKAVRICSITSSEAKGRPVLSAGHKHPSVMNWPCRYTMDFFSGGFFPNFLQNTRWTAIHDSVFANSSTQNAFSGWANAINGSEYLQNLKRYLEKS